MFVKNMKKSKIQKEVGCTQPLERDVAPRSLMSVETESLSDSKTLLIITAVLEACMCTVLSDDVWTLTFSQAQHTCEKIGISKKEFDKVLIKLLEARKQRFKVNPMSGMF